jgi:protein-tyrosine phosphatase
MSTNISPIETMSVKNFKIKSMTKSKTGHAGNDYVACIIGKRGTGKTTLIKDLLIKTSRKNIYVFSESGNGFYGENFPEAVIYNEFYETVLESLIDVQRNSSKKLPITIVFDDIIYSIKSRNSKVFKELLMNGRHNNITLILSLQYCMGLSPDLRSNIDYVFSLKCVSNKSSQEKLYKTFFGIIPKFSDFQQVFKSCVDDYGAMVLDNTSRSNKIEDNVFWYKADNPITKKICQACHKEYSGFMGLLQHHTRNKMCKKWTDILEKNNDIAKKIQETYEESHNLRDPVHKCEACLKEFSNVGNLNKHFRGNPECQKLCAFGYATPETCRPDPDNASNTFPVEPTQNTKWLGPDGTVSDYEIKGYRPFTVEINFQAYDPKSNIFEEAPPKNDSKLVHIIWNLMLTDKTQVSNIDEEISKNNIHHIIAILPDATDYESIKPKNSEISYDVLEYGTDHNPVISDEMLEKYEECYEKMAEMQKSRKNVLIFCNNGYQRSLPFICNYLIKHHNDEVPDLDRALDIVLSQVDKENYSVVKEATKNSLLMLRTEYMTPFFTN